MTEWTTEWLSDPRKWSIKTLSPHPVRNPTERRKLQRSCLAVKSDDELDELIAKNSYWEKC